MRSLYSTLGRSFLFQIDAEKAHKLSISALSKGLHPNRRNDLDTRLAVNVSGLQFPNPLGMAAGYDKNGDVPDALLRMGFGHTEVGTITPKPQPGNSKPRIFRLREDEGVINRLGFNSDGHALAQDKLSQCEGRPGIVGINIGANKTSENFVADYVKGIHAFSSHASYFTINISSPNTPGLRALQEADPLAELIKRVCDARSLESEKQSKKLPLFLKIAPDLSENELDDIADAVERSELDALIVSNTTLSREGLQSSNANEAGGLSGKPLFKKSTIALAKMFQRIGKNTPLVGVGGITDVDSAFNKIEAGATLIQLYSGMVFAGPRLPGDIVDGLSRKLDKENIKHVSDVVGRAAQDWADRSI